jgi:T5orf172 domain
MTEQAGYVYVLLTGYTDKSGVPLAKVGCTSRTPDHRNREISRGGPVGTTVVGAITTRDMVGLERKAHQAFLRVRFIGDGGTEYFAANPNEVLAWLRAETPRFEIESARNSAWHEYVGSRPWKTRANVGMTGFSTFMIIWFVGSFWVLGASMAWMMMVMPFIAGAAGIGLWYCLKEMLLQNVDTELKAVRVKLEEKYHLPTDILLAGPTAGYKDNARRR